MADDEPKEKGSQDSNIQPPWFNSRMGVGMPGGAQITDFNRTPDDVENPEDYWRGQAVQLEKAVQDLGSLHSRHVRDQSFWSNTSDDDQPTPEEFLSQLWTRSIELVGVFAAITFIIQLYGGGLSPIAQISGAVAVTAVFDRWIRPVISEFTE
jgi:hypothetical protein